MPNRKIAIMYDFDKTLCTKNMQEFTFIPKFNMDIKEFWKTVLDISKKNNMDPVLSYMKLMIDTAKASGIKREDFVVHGKNLIFYDGVEDFFDRIGCYADGIGYSVEHYIISSGLREIIEGSPLYGKFKEVFACEFLYDENGNAIWPKNVVNYTTKTQFLFRINKGVLDLSNDYDLNRYTPEEKRPVPFEHMIYIGDGMTDVPCMKLVKTNGGHSIAVYSSSDDVLAKELLEQDRVNFVANADYTEGSRLDAIIKSVIDKIAADDRVNGF